MRTNRFKMFAFAACLFLASSAPLCAVQLAARAPEEWIKTLESPQRVQSQKVDDVIARLGLKPGQVIADIGAGSGLFSRPLAKAVAPGGKVALIEMNKDDPNTAHRGQPELLVGREDIEKWMRDAGFKLVQEHPYLFPGAKWFLIYGKN